MYQRIEDLARQWTAAQPAVAVFITTLIPDLHDAQDILQEVAATIFSRDFAQQGFPQNFKAWAIGIARHKALDFHRRKSAAARHFMFEAATIDQLAAATENFADEIDLRREALRRCMERIPAKSLHLVELRYKLGLSPGDIAEQTQAGVSAVKTALHRIRLALRNCVEQRLAHQAGGL